MLRYSIVSINNILISSLSAFAELIRKIIFRFRRRACIILRKSISPLRGISRGSALARPPFSPNSGSPRHVPTQAHFPIRGSHRIYRPASAITLVRVPLTFSTHGCSLKKESDEQGRTLGIITYPYKRNRRSRTLLVISLDAASSGNSLFGTWSHQYSMIM